MRSSAKALAIAIAFAASPALGDDLPLPRAAYSADVTYSANGRLSHGKIYVDGPKERRDLTDSTGRETLKIFRRDQGKLYELRPARKLAIAMRIAAAAASGEAGPIGTDIDELYGASAIKDGQETINGLQTTRYLVRLEPSPGLVTDSTVWCTEDGIIVRIVGKTSVESGDPARMDLTNVSRGAQDAALFEVPPGMELISAGGDSEESGAAGKPPSIPPVSRPTPPDPAAGTPDRP